MEGAYELEVQPMRAQSQGPGEVPGGSISVSFSLQPSQPGANGDTAHLYSPSSPASTSLRTGDQLRHMVNKTSETGLLSPTPKPWRQGPVSQALPSQVSAGSTRPSCLPIPAVQEAGTGTGNREEGTLSHYLPITSCTNLEV